MHPTVSLATVYKTLQILTEHGLIQELDLPQSQTRFDSYVEPHINLVCMQCGNIQDLNDKTAQEMVESDDKGTIHADRATLRHIRYVQDMSRQDQIARTASLTSDSE